MALACPNSSRGAAKHGAPTHLAQVRVVHDVVGLSARHLLRRRRLLLRVAGSLLVLSLGTPALALLLLLDALPLQVPDVLVIDLPLCTAACRPYTCSARAGTGTMVKQRFACGTYGGAMHGISEALGLVGDRADWN